MSHRENKTIFDSGHWDLSEDVTKCIIVHSNTFGRR